MTTDSCVVSRFEYRYKVLFHQTCVNDFPGFHYLVSPLAQRPVGTSVSSMARLLRDGLVSLSEMQVPIYLDGPYNGSSARVWTRRHVLLIAGGIGVTPFASLLQSLVARHRSALRDCPHCARPVRHGRPPSLGKLQHVGCHVAKSFHSPSSGP